MMLSLNVKAINAVVCRVKNQHEKFWMERPTNKTPLTQFAFGNIVNIFRLKNLNATHHKRNCHTLQSNGLLVYCTKHFLLLVAPFILVDSNTKFLHFSFWMWFENNFFPSDLLRVFFYFPISFVQLDSRLWVAKKLKIVPIKNVLI